MNKFDGTDLFRLSEGERVAPRIPNCLRGAVETVETMKAFHLAPEVREQFSELQLMNFKAYFGADSGILYGSGIVVVVDVSSSFSLSTTSDRNCFVLDNRASLT